MEKIYQLTKSPFKFIFLTTIIFSMIGLIIGLLLNIWFEDIVLIINMTLSGLVFGFLAGFIHLLRK